MSRPSNAYRTDHTPYQDAFQQPPLALGSYKDHIVARPSPETSGETLVSNMLVVSSADRNSDAYPNTHDFVLNLEKPLTDVVSLELVNGCVPRTDYNVNACSNLVHFQETAGATLVATVPVGNYDIAGLLPAVGAAMTAASASGVTYSASVSPLTSRVTVSAAGGSAATFALVAGTPQRFGDAQRTWYVPGTLLRSLGFAPAGASTAAGGSVTATGVYKLSGSDSVLISLDQAAVLQGPSDVAQDAFCIINFGDQAWGSVKAIKMSDFGTKNTKFFNPVLKRLQRMHFRFMRPEGGAYDFNGADVTLVFEVKTLFKQLAR